MIPCTTKKCLLSDGFLSTSVAVLLVLVLCAGCGQKPLAKGKDFSNASSVSILLGEKDKDFGDGLQHAYWEKDGLTTPAVVDGLACRYLKVEEFDPGYLYFILDATFKKRSVKKVKIEVEYFDEEPGLLGIQYDARGFRKLPERAYTPLDQTVQLAGSRMWQTATFHIRNATFKNGQNSGADFRFSVSPPELYVRRVAVTRVR
jgi:hypothetical protein